MSGPSFCRYTTAGGISITRHTRRCNGADELRQRMQLLDTQPGVLLSCSSEYPGRYQRRDLLLVNPPLQLTARHNKLSIRALNARGAVLLPAMQSAFANLPSVTVQTTPDSVVATVQATADAETFSEEMRTRRRGLFDLLRAVTAQFASDQDALLGLYGAFAYDLAFQLEPVRQRLSRPAQQRDLVLYLPDEILLHEPQTGTGTLYSYEFVCADHDGRLQTTGGLKREVDTRQHHEFRFGAATRQTQSAAKTDVVSDHAPGEYAAVVGKARQYFVRGDLFEAVPGQTFSRLSTALPSALFLQLQADNPAPYGALINLGQSEFLISASPEMYVRVRDGLVESCPISGTIARGADALADAEQIRILLNSEKDEAELSMCTDVDRNDKSRVCTPGSVRIIGRRQVELYSRLIHTVDHVQGQLQAQFDALDAFLTHTWAVTVTGAPKAAAMQFLEDHEKTPRGWYGGAFGCVGFNGSLDTGLTLRTIHLRDQIASVRVGATLLLDSDPQAEEAETRLKASALLDVLAAVNSASLPESPDVMRRSRNVAPMAALPQVAAKATGLRALMVDHQDSFVLTLAAGFRAHGVTLQTLRPAAARRFLRDQTDSDLPDLVILSPGPGRPRDFDCAAILALCERLAIPVFGVCLGLQAMVEYGGGTLAVLDTAVHGKPGLISHGGHPLFAGLPSAFKAGRYHSLHAARVPDAFDVIAHTALPEPCVMAIAHKTLPWLSVQFHPESLLTMDGGAGEQLIANVVTHALRHRRIRTDRGAGSHRVRRQTVAG